MSLMYTGEEQEFRAQLQDFLKQELEPLVPKIESEELSPVEFIRKLGANVTHRGKCHVKFLGQIHHRDSKVHRRPITE